MRHFQQPHSTARGFTLIEALVALLVTSFGMLALAGFQAKLTYSADVAKQRAEATRLAQQKIEDLRSYGQVASDVSVFDYTDDVVSGTDPSVSNANFTRTWTVTANTADTEKWINVVVAWTDRTGRAQTVTLQSVISKFDPRDVGRVAVPGNIPSQQRRPKNRNINIPYPAVTLSGGTTSAFMPPPGNVAYVFDNQTGNIIQSCSGLTPAGTSATPFTIQTIVGTGTNTVTVNASGHNLVGNNSVTIAASSNAALNGTFTVLSTSPGASFTVNVANPYTGSATGGTATQVVTQLVEGLSLASAAGVTCVSIDAYLLSGYVRFDTGNNPTGEEPGNPGASNETLPLNASTPLTLTSTNNPSPNNGGAPAMTCYSQRQKVVTTSPSAVNISSVSRSSSTVTVTTATSHGFSTGSVVAINAVTSAVFDGAYTVQSVPSTTSFTYTLPPPLPAATSSTGGTAVLVQRLTIPETTSVSGYSTLVAKFVSYACIVTPVDHDTNSATPKRWWGKVTLNANSSSSAGTVWQIGNGNGDYRICRYSADWNSNSAIANSEHPRWYRGVTGALDSQNFLVISSGSNCPTDRAQDLFSNPVNFADDTTAGHQPSSIEEFSFQCSNAACNGGNKVTRENTTTTADISMD